jgi:hypothetical protein
MVELKNTFSTMSTLVTHVYERVYDEQSNSCTWALQLARTHSPSFQEQFDSRYGGRILLVSRVSTRIVVTTTPMNG